MRQRNRLFQMREGSRALFEGLEEQMAEAGTAIAAARLDAFARLAGADRADARGARTTGPFPWAVIALEGGLEEALSRSCRRPRSRTNFARMLRVKAASATARPRGPLKDRI